MELEFGPYAASIRSQLTSLGVKLDMSLIDEAQADADAVTRLYRRQIISEHDAGRARSKLTKRLEAEIGWLSKKVGTT